ncbi:MAG: extracellular solute-binding protein [Chloroflexota bacterium]
MTQKQLSRRDFLRLTGVTAAGFAAAACATPTATQSPTSAPVPVPATSAPAATAIPPTAAPTARPVVNADWWTVAGADVGNKADQEAMLDEYLKSPSGAWAKIKATFLPDDGFSEKMTTVLGTGSGAPDVTTFWTADWFPAAVDLRERIAKDKVDINMYSKVHFDSRCRFGEQIIGLPIGVGATMNFYNKTLFEKAGLKEPQWGYTLQQYLQDAVKMTDKSKKIFGAAMPTRVWRGEFFAFGARPFSDDGKKVDGFMNGPKTVKAFEFISDLARSGSVPTAAEFEVIKTEGTGPLDLFNTGRLGFAGLNNGQFLLVDKAGVKFGLGHNPKVDGEDIITNGWTLQIGIPKASKNQDAAWEYLKWFTGAPGQSFLMKRNNGFTPTIPSLWKDHPAANDERVKFFFEILKTKQIWEFSGQFPYFAKVTRLNQDLFDGIYLNKIKRADIKSELDKVVPAAQKIVDEERAKLGLK